VATQRAVFYERAGRYFVCPHLETDDLEIERGVEVLEGDVDDAVLGEAISRALDAFEYRRGKLDETELQESQRAFLSAAGVRSYGKFMQGASSVGSERSNGGAVRLEPLANLGPREGFEPRPESAVELVNPAQDELGRVTRQLASREL
jgi:hypothetical protein